MNWITMFATDVSEEMQQTIRDNPDKVYFPNLGGDNIFTNGISIDRKMFTIPGTDFTIYWYGFLIAVGILLAMLYGYKRMKKFGIDPDRATDGVIGGLIGAIFGARLYYILFNQNGLTMKDFFKFRDGGLAIYGGIIGAIVVGGIIVKLRKLKLTAMLDVVAPCFLIGQAIGRWGNFFNQEAFGANTDLPWGMMSNSTISYLAENDGLIASNTGEIVSCFAPVHPCFLYESLWCILCFVIIHLYTNHRKFDGELFLMYTGLYGLGRFFIESTRTDSLYLLNIKVSQLLAGACVIASIILIIIFRSMVKRDGEYKFFYQTELSKMQLKAYDNYEESSKEKKELKRKIREAKEKGESFIELEKEYDEKFGKGAKEKEKEAIEKDKESTPDSEYKSILGDEDDKQDEANEKKEKIKEVKTEEKKEEKPEKAVEPVKEEPKSKERPKAEKKEESKGTSTNGGQKNNDQRKSNGGQRTSQQKKGQQSGQNKNNNQNRSNPQNRSGNNNQRRKSNKNKKRKKR